jgi:hypothetical protein
MKRMVFEKDGNIYIADSHYLDEKQLIFSRAAGLAGWPAWSPDGGRIAWGSWCINKRRTHIYVFYVED